MLPTLSRGGKRDSNNCHRSTQFFCGDVPDDLDIRGPHVRGLRKLLDDLGGLSHGRTDSSQPAVQSQPAGW